MFDLSKFKAAVSCHQDSSNPFVATMGDIMAEALDEIERLNLELAQGKYREGAVCGYCSHSGSLMLAKIERLQAIIDKLPKTADGVPVVPGMILFDPVWIDRHFPIEELLVYCPDATRSEWHDGEVDVSQCYSTKAAAKAAKGK